MNSNELKKQKDPAQKDIEFILNLLNLNKLKDAKKEIDQQIINFPNSPILFNMLGAVFAGEDKFYEAIKNYKEAIKINPGYAQAYNNLAVALQKLEKLNEAVENYKKAISLKSNFIEALDNLGNAYQDLGKKKEALDSFEKVIKIKPDYAEAYHNLGMIHSDLNNFEEALLNYNKAIQLKSNQEKFYSNLGVLLNNLGRYDEATVAFHKAIKIKPDYSIAYSNLLFNLNYKTDFDVNFYLQEAKKFRFNCKKDKKLNFKYQYEKNPKKIKLGLMSADFGNHPGGFFTLSTLRELRKKNFELIAYSTQDRNDDFSYHFKPLFSKWHSVKKKKDIEIVKQIAEDGIHILIDLQGHSAQNRLTVFMHKPAPIQLSWLGQGSTGIPEIDYFIGSNHITPKHEDNHYTEKVLRLPKISQCFTPPDFDVKINSLPALKNNFITFGCINKLSKVNDKVINLWSKILLSVPNSKLLLKSKELDEQKIINKTLTRFEAHKIKKNQIILYGLSISRQKTLEIYNQIDIALDPFPFQGNTSSIESVWMGVPVIVLKGNRYLSHFGESINLNLNMQDWIAKDYDEYISKAVKFSSDINKLSEIRIGLRKMLLSSPICDPVDFTKHFSSMLYEIWEKFNTKR